MSAFIIELEYDHTQIGCNPGPLEIELNESKWGAINLARHFKKIFRNVELWEDTTQEMRTKIKIPKK